MDRGDEQSADDVAELASEIPVTFDCREAALMGILHRPSTTPTVGMVIVVGGPQYRVGSHRLFVSLARDLAALGVAVMRFDCRGMGDSEGEFAGFEMIEPDIEAAITALVRFVPSVSRVMLWGLCDGASAISMYAHQDRRIAGIALINPWVRTVVVQARAYLRHYYLQRLAHPTFLRKLMSGEFNVFEAAHSLFHNIVQAARGELHGRAQGPTADGTLHERMAVGLRKFSGSVLLITSGQDLTAREFDDVTRRSRRWQEIFAANGFQRHDLKEADHTFSRREWREQMTIWTENWLKQIAMPNRVSIAP